MQRIARTAAATLTHTFYVGETPTDPTGTPTVAVVDANGAAVDSGNATVVGGSSGRVTFALDPVATLETLTVTWTATVAGTTVVETDYAEVVGGFFFGLAEGRAADSSLADTSKYPESALVVARVEVEAECEEICDRAFVPRYQRVVLDGSGTSELVLEHSSPNRSVADVRTIRSVSMAPTLDGDFTAFTADQLAALAVTADHTLVRTDGAVWTEERGNVVVEYEYGLSSPPPDLRRAALVRFRSRLNIHRTGVPDRAVSFAAADGGTYRIDLPGQWKTGIPDVDAVYARYSRRSGAGTGINGRSVPASRQLNFDPQRHTLFHGGVR